MKSVPPRGSGWVRTVEKASHLPTRYREVVLTSLPTAEVSAEAVPVGGAPPLNEHLVI